MAITGSAVTGYTIGSSATETINANETYTSSSSRTLSVSSGVAGNLTTVTNNGVITNTAFGSLTMGEPTSSYVSLTNNGTISGKNAVISLSTNVNISNYGTISTTGNMAYAVNVGQDSAINNYASGVISTAGDYAIRFGAGAAMSNYGVITGGIYIPSSASQGSTITNFGTINGPIWDDDGNFTFMVRGGSVGAITMGGGTDWINVLEPASIGASDGGTGNDTFTINPGAGKTLTLNGNVINFESFTASSGQVNTTGHNIGSTWITFQSGSTLTGGGGLTGDVNLQAGSTLVAGVNMTYSVTGTLTLGGSLDLQTGGVTGQEVTLIKNDGADAVIGSFDNITAGINYIVGDYIYRLSYVGGTGNDVTLTVVYAPPLPEPAPVIGTSNSPDAPITTNSAGMVNQSYYGDESDQLGLGDAHDLIYGMGGADLLQGNNGNDTLFGNWDNDTLTGNGGADYLYGGKQEDWLFGDDNDDMLSGNRENDTLNGGVGNDTLYGGQENDALFGNDDADILWGDLGNDTLTGGAGADRFEFSARSGQDVITDFSGQAGDRISLNGQTVLQTTSTADGAVLGLSGGGSILLRGISAISIEASWFV